MGKVKYETSGFISNAMTDFHAAAHRDPLRKAEGSKQVLSGKKKTKQKTADSYSIQKANTETYKLKFTP